MNNTQEFHKENHNKDSMKNFCFIRNIFSMVITIRVTNCFKSNSIKVGEIIMLKTFTS